jgi:hypothetical protein
MTIYLPIMEDKKITKLESASQSYKTFLRP